MHSGFVQSGLRAGPICWGLNTARNLEKHELHELHEQHFLIIIETHKHRPLYKNYVSDVVLRFTLAAYGSYLMKLIISINMMLLIYEFPTFD